MTTSYPFAAPRIPPPPAGYSRDNEAQFRGIVERAFQQQTTLLRETTDAAQVDFWIEDYGADPTGLIDSSPAIQAAFDAALAVYGGAVRAGPGTFRWDTEVTVDTALVASKVGNLQFLGSGQQATLFLPTVAPALRVGSYTYDGFHAADFSFGLTQSLGFADGLIHLQYTRQWHFARIGLLSGRSYTDGHLEDYSGFLFNFDTSYQGIVEKCWNYGRRTYLAEINDEVNPNEQTDTYSFLNCVSTGMAQCLIRGTTGPTDVHNVNFDTCKHLMVASWPEAGVSVETTLTSSPAAADTSFTVDSVTDLAVGNQIWVGMGTTLELVEINTIVGLTITTVDPLRYAHTSADPVLMGGLTVSTALAVWNVALTHQHVEYVACAVYNAGGRNIRVTDLYGGCKEIIRNIDAVHTTSGLRVERGAWHWDGAGTQCAIRVTTAGDAAGHGCYYMDGPFRDQNTGNPPAVLFQNDAGTRRSYRITNHTEAGVTRTTVAEADLTSTTLLETVMAANNTIFERDFAGQNYAVRHTFKRVGVAAASGTVDIDPEVGDYYSLTLTGNCTVGVPDNQPDERGQLLKIRVYNNSGGTIATTFSQGTSGSYQLQGPWVDPLDGKSRLITFLWEFSTDRWLEVSRSFADEGDSFQLSRGMIGPARLVSKGTTHVAGDYALSAGWGTTASIASVSATDMGGRVSITSSGTGQVANPTVTLTWKDGAWSTAPVVVAKRSDLVNPVGEFYATSTGTSTAVFTANFIPVAGSTYILEFNAEGKIS